MIFVGSLVISWYNHHGPLSPVLLRRSLAGDRAGCAMSSYEDPEVEAFPAGVAKRGELTESQKEMKAEREKAQMAQMLGAKARA